MSRSYQTNTRQNAASQSESSKGFGKATSFPAVQLKTEARLLEKPNWTGMPNQLKSGIEGLSGMDMSDVKVHFNSSQPAQLNALAYAQGNDIHIGPGQEQHLPHEAWHVVQQRQGRVSATAQLKTGAAVNDDPRLEHEADVMGDKAMAFGNTCEKAHIQLYSHGSYHQSAPVQRRKIGKMGLEAEVIGERFEMMSLNSFPESEILADPEVVLEEYSLGSIRGGVDVTLDNELKYADEISKRRSFTVEFVQDAVDVIEGDPVDLEQRAMAWASAGAFWKTNMLGGRKVFGMAGKAVDWFKENKHWKGGQFEAYRNNRNVSKDGQHQLFWDGPGFFSYINAKSEDPDVSMQMTAGSTLEELQTAFAATSTVLSGNQVATDEQIANHKLEQREDADLYDQDYEARAFLKILGHYYQSSFNASIKQTTKRYNKEHIPMMIRNSLDSVFYGMSEGAKAKFIEWVKIYASKNEGPITDFIYGGPRESFFFGKTTKETESETIKNGEVLLSIVGPWMKKIVPPGEVFAQKGLAGISEINNNNQEALTKYRLNHAGEMMPDVKGLIFENRAAKTRKLSEVPGILMSLANVLKEVNK